MSSFDQECLEYFIENQEQLLRERVAETPEEAEEFLEDCMAVVCKNLREVKEYFKEAGTDISGMSDDDILEHLNNKVLDLVINSKYIKIY